MAIGLAADHAASMASYAAGAWGGGTSASLVHLDGLREKNRVCLKKPVALVFVGAYTAPPVTTLGVSPEVTAIGESGFGRDLQGFLRMFLRQYVDKDYRAVERLLVWSYGLGWLCLMVWLASWFDALIGRFCWFGKSVER